MKLHTGQKKTTFGYIFWGLSGNSCFSFSFREDLLPEINLQMIKMQNCKWYSRRCWEWEWREKMMIMEQTMNNDREDELQEEVWWGERETESPAAPRTTQVGLTIQEASLGRPSQHLLHQHFPAWRCPCPSSNPKRRGLVSRWSLRTREAQWEEEQTANLSGAHLIFQANDQNRRDNFEKWKCFELM